MKKSVKREEHRGVLGVTHSACGVCGQIGPARVTAARDEIWFETFCREHGTARTFVRGDVAEYLDSQRFVKPAALPLAFAGRSESPCPEGCGFCARHEQHLCLPIIEITSRCDLACPICLVDAGGDWDMTPAEFRSILDNLLRTEPQIPVLNLSGGEPLLHPRLLDLVDEALGRPEVLRVSISTNGLRLLSDRALVEGLRDRGVVVSLQFDGFDEKACEELRGRPLLERKLRLLDLLEARDMPVSLTFTAARGVNDDQFGPLLDFFFSRPHVISMTIQPVAFAGRAAGLPPENRRLTLPDVIGLLGRAGHPSVRSSDFLPLPCSHPLCFSLSFYVMPDGGQEAVAVNRLVETGALREALSNRAFYGLDAGEFEHLKEMVYELWSGPAAASPDTVKVMETLREILRSLSSSPFDPGGTFRAAERRVKSIFIHAFQDGGTFDLSRTRRCCTAYALPDGRLMPACAYNVLHRSGRRPPSGPVSKGVTDV